jgi:FkbM family methyltransferase
MSLKDVARRLVERSGYVIHRWPGNRFDAMDAALQMLVDRGYRPKVVIDGGANRGQWFGIASTIFPEARFHLIEAQDVCWPDLERVAAARGRTVLHQTAITAPGASFVRMHRAGVPGSTGAFVVAESEGLNVDVQAPATTLDGLLATAVTRDDRVLLKLDIEGHEVEALRGATVLLGAVEVIVCEVRFFDVDRSGRPLFGEVLVFLEARGFMLYDFDMLSSRQRDRRLRIGDAIFVRRDSALAEDVWAE